MQKGGERAAVAVVRGYRGGRRKEEVEEGSGRVKRMGQKPETGRYRWEETEGVSGVVEGRGG